MVQMMPAFLDYRDRENRKKINRDRLLFNKYDERQGTKVFWNKVKKMLMKESEGDSLWIPEILK